MPVRLAILLVVLALAAGATVGATATGAAPTSAAAPATGAAANPPPKPGRASDAEIRAYYDSGRFARDVGKRLARARRSLRLQLADRRRREGRPAIVLDIDDTSLGTYECQRELGGFGSAELAACVVQAGFETTAGGRGLPALAPTLKLYRLAKRRGVQVLFITGRPQAARQTTKQNLWRRGFNGEFELTMRPEDDFASGGSSVPYKSGARGAAERRGFEILVNVGDQRSDLRGGHANTTIKIPNPMYLTE